MSRNKNVTFSLNTGYEGGKTVLEVMSELAVTKAASQIRDRANRISESMREHPQEFAVEMGIGIPNRKGGTRFYCQVQGINETPSREQRNLDYQALHLALDAGKVTHLSPKYADGHEVVV